MEIEREAPGNDKARSWRANVAQEDSKSKLDGGDQPMKVTWLSSYFFQIISVDKTS